MFFFFSNFKKKKESNQILFSQHLQLKDTLQTLVIDEADFILSFGYDEDIRKLLKYLPSICQTFLMSATLTPVIFIISFYFDIKGLFQIDNDIHLFYL